MNRSSEACDSIDDSTLVQGRVACTHLPRFRSTRLHLYSRRSREPANLCYISCNMCSIPSHFTLFYFIFTMFYSSKHATLDVTAVRMSMDTASFKSSLRSTLDATMNDESARIVPARQDRAQRLSPTAGPRLSGKMADWQCRLTNTFDSSCRKAFMISVLMSRRAKTAFFASHEAEVQACRW